MTTYWRHIPSHTYINRMMYKYTISPEWESQQQERVFEEEFGRPMTLEEKKMYSLSAEFLENAPPNETDTDVRGERHSNLRVMPSWRASPRNKTA